MMAKAKKQAKGGKGKGGGGAPGAAPAGEKEPKMKKMNTDVTGADPQEIITNLKDKMSKTVENTREALGAIRSFPQTFRRRRCVFVLPVPLYLSLEDWSPVHKFIHPTTPCPNTQDGPPISKDVGQSHGRGLRGGNSSSAGGLALHVRIA
jgi:hypothetical protein